MLQNILVIGATGNFGLPVTQALIEHGLEVTAMVRNPEKAAKILPPDVDLIQGNLQDINSIERALVGQDAIYLNLSIKPSEHKNAFHPEKEGIKTLLQAAKHSGIQRIFYLSSLLKNYPSDNWLLQIKKQAVQLLKKANIPVTIFYPSLFMETIPDILMKKNRIYIPGSSKIIRYWIAAEDYARQVATAVKANSFSEVNIDYIIQGQEGITLEDAIKKFIKSQKGYKFKTLFLPLNILKKISFLHPQIFYITILSKAILEYPEVFSASKSWNELGKPEITFKEFANKINNNLHLGQYSK